MDHIASLLLGIGNGGVYAALALALVITYRASGVVNFATGAVALYVAYTYAGLRKGELLVPVPGLPKTVDLGQELGFVPAVALALVAAALLGALLYVLVFRPLRDAPQLAQAVASLGVLVVLQGVLAIRQGTNAVSVRAIFPTDRWELGSVRILSDRFYLAVTIVVLAVLLAAAFRYTRFGLLTRATAESQTGAAVSGVSPDRVALVNWMISAMVAGVAGILIAPVSPLTPVTYTLFVVPALAAAVVGRFQMLVPIVAAGIAIGMLQSEALSLVSDFSWMPTTGAAELVPLIVILVALVIIGGGMPARGGLIRQRLGRAPRPRSLLVPTVAGSVVGLVALVATDGTWRAAVIGTFIAAVIGLSLVVVTGYAGQVSLAQLALAGCAAFTLSGLTEGWGVPFPLAPLLAALVATAIGVVVGLPALRLRGLTLGVVTLALAYAIEAVWFRNTDVVSTSGARVTPPLLFGVDLDVGSGHDFPRIEFGLVCLVTLVAVSLGVAVLRRSALGSAMLAVRANERSAAAAGVDVVRVKVLSFALASFIAGLGGSLLAYRRGVVTFESFTAIGGLALLSTGYLAGITSVWGGINAGILASSGIAFVALDRWVDLGEWFQVITGVLLIFTLITNPEGIAAGGHEIADRWARWRRGHRRRGPRDRRPLGPLAGRSPGGRGRRGTPAGRGRRGADTRSHPGHRRPGRGITGRCRARAGAGAGRGGVARRTRTGAIAAGGVARRDRTGAIAGRRGRGVARRRRARVRAGGDGRTVARRGAPRGGSGGRRAGGARGDPAAHRQPHRALRRRARRQRGLAAGRAGHGGGPHRAQRRREDQRHRRRHRLRCCDGHGRAGGAAPRRPLPPRPGARRPGPHLPVAGALRRPLGRGERRCGGTGRPAQRSPRRRGPGARQRRHRAAA